MPLSEFLDDELNKPSVFKDESKLSNHYIPENLFFRTEELRTIVRHFKSLFTTKPTSKRLIIHGRVGSGKTTIAKRFGLWVMSQSPPHTLEYIHINCRMNQSPYVILLVVAKELNPHIPTRGFSSQELLKIILEILESKQMYLILVLDEIDYIQDEELSNLIYALTRINEDKIQKVSPVSLILISRHLNFLEMLDPSTRSTLSAATLYLDKYSVEELHGIVTDRVEGSFKSDTVSSESITLASEIAGHRGDPRLAIELLWFAGKYADQDGSSVVYPDYIRRAKSNIEPTIRKQSFDILDFHKLLLLLGIVKGLQVDHIAHLTIDAAREAYQHICEEYSETPRQHTQIWSYLKLLERLDIITLIRSGKALRGQTQYISIEDASLQEIEHEVISRIIQKTEFQQ